MKVGYAGRWSPLDKTAWSGIYFQTYQAIQQQHEVSVFHYHWPWYVRESLILHKQLQKLVNKKAAVEFLRGYAKYFSKQLEKDLKGSKADILFVPAAPQLIAYCNSRIPIIYMADASFYQLQGYYPLFRDIAQYNIDQGIALDKLAFDKSSHCMLASEWAKGSVMHDYDIPEQKLTVVPFGANLEKIPFSDSLKRKPNNCCQLLFLGVEWERKGGQIALDCFYQLKKAGIDVRLTIIGCVPPVAIIDRQIFVIPFLNKNNQEDTEKLYEIMRQTDFLILPTRAECAGIVFCEASAFGIPVISTDTGGVSSYVQDGINGFTLPLTATADAYADIILKLYQDTAAYEQLSISSRNKFESTLNWNHWGQQFNVIADRIVNQ